MSIMCAALMSVTGGAAAWAQPASPAVSTPTFPAIAGISTVSDLIQHFNDIDQRLSTLTASFRQTVSVPDTGMEQRIQGTLSYRKPEYLRLEHDKPERQTVVSDGKNIWVYRPGENEVIQSSLQDWKQADPVSGRLLDFGNYSRLLSEYAVAFDSNTQEVTLTPKNTKQDFKLRLRLTGPSLFPTETTLLVGQMKIRTALTDLEFDRPLSKDLFKFTPPPSADVFRNFKPPMPEGIKP